MFERFSRRPGQTKSIDQVGVAQFNVSEARTHLCRLVERAATGEEIVIARSGVPLAKLVPYRHAEVRYPGIVSARVILDPFRVPRGRL